MTFQNYSDQSDQSKKIFSMTFQDPVNLILSFKYLWNVWRSALFCIWCYDVLYIKINPEFRWSKEKAIRNNAIDDSARRLDKMKQLIQNKLKIFQN